MSNISPEIRGIAVAERGLIVQRVLVDGWSPAQVAAAFGLRERQVARWVADYRRYGMASLRDEAALRRPPRRWLRRLRMACARLAAALRGEFETQPARCIVLRRGSDDRRPHPLDPDRRSLWN
jgi:hypothetical protein